jgi:multidrug transporter EmrE-like cation transporter
MQNVIKLILSINYFYWLIISMVFYAGGEYLSKKFAMNPRFNTVILILIFYSLGVLAWLVALWRRDELAVVGATWATLSVLTTISIGIFIFGEKLSPLGLVGIITATVAILLLSIA